MPLAEAEVEISMDQHGDAEDPCSDARREIRRRTLESGPKFRVRERVLAVDSLQSGETVVAEGRERSSPLYEAIVLKSGLKCVDPTSGAIVHPVRKKKSGHSQHHNNLPHHSRQDRDGAGDGDGTREWCHLVHFQGWNSRHDRWMREADVFHDTPENRTRVGTKVEENKMSKKRGRIVKDNIGAEDVALGPDIRNPYDKNLQLITRACTLPFTLQTILIDDGDKITKRVHPPLVFNGSDNLTDQQHRGITMLHVLPVKRSIIDIIGDYIRDGKRHDLEAFANERERQRVEEDRRKASADNVINKDDEKVAMPTDDDPNNDNEQLSNYSTISTKAVLRLKKKKRKKFALSVIALVDISLPLFLLYKEERKQYAKFVGGGDNCARANSGGKNIEGNDGTDGREDNGPHKRPSELYGAVHLLRFLVKLPFILSQYDCKNPNSGKILDGSEGKTPTDVFILASKDLSRDFADHLLELAVFLQRKNKDCFTREYFTVAV